MQGRCLALGVGGHPAAAVVVARPRRPRRVARRVLPCPRCRRSAGSSVDRYAESTALADVVAFIDGEPERPLLDRLAADPRITAIDRSNPVVIVAEPIEAGESGFALVGTADAPAGGFAAPMLLAGRYPSADAATEIVVNERAAQTYGFEVGMRAPLSGLVSFESWEARQLGEATIVGIVRTPFDLVDDPSTESLVIAGPGFLDGGWGNSPAPARSCSSTGRP